MSAAIEIAGLAVDYPRTGSALRGIDLAIGRDERVALLGPSGSGKSTIARAIFGLLPIGTRVAGSIKLAGRELVGLAPQEHRRLRGRAVGYVPQDPHAGCDPIRSVGHHVEEAWRAHGLRPPAGKVAGLLGDLGITEPEHRMRQRPYAWSGGMLQRASIAAAVAHDPPLTIADEPTSALDQALKARILAALAAKCRAMLLITHDFSLIADQVDRVLICAEGVIVETGTPAAIMARPQHRVTRSLLNAAEPYLKAAGA